MVIPSPLPHLVRFVVQDFKYIFFYVSHAVILAYARGIQITMSPNSAQQNRIEIHGFYLCRKEISPYYWLVDLRPILSDYLLHPILWDLI